MDDGVEDPKRRALLQRVGGACGAALGAAVLVGPVGVAVSPLLRGDAGQTPAEGASWLAAGALASFVIGKPRRVVLRRDVRDAWLVRRDVPIGIVLVERLADGDGERSFRVLSGTCPHLGCAVSAKSDGARETTWLCPCHDSVFSRDGSLVPGRDNPSPRGLDPLPWRVAGGALEVQWLRFEIGTAERRVIG